MGNPSFIVQGAVSALAASWAASAGSGAAVMAEASLCDAPQFAHFETDPSQGFNKIMARFQVAPIFRMDSEIKVSMASHSADGPGSTDNIGAPPGSGSSDGGGPRKGLIDLLLKLLHNEDSKVREKTVRKIARIGARQDVSKAIPDLIELAMYDEDEDVQEAIDEVSMNIWRYNRPKAIREFRARIAKAVGEEDLKALVNAALNRSYIDPEFVTLDDFLKILKSPFLWKDKESSDHARWIIFSFSGVKNIKDVDAARVIEILLPIAFDGYYYECTDDPDIIRMPRLSRFEGTHRKRRLSRKETEEKVASLSEDPLELSEESLEPFRWILHYASDGVAAARCEAIGNIGNFFAGITQSASIEAHIITKFLKKMGHEERLSYLAEYAEENEGVEEVLWYQVLNTLDFIAITDGDAMVRHAAEEALEKIFAAAEDK